jgi:hypothetical protein
VTLPLALLIAICIAILLFVGEVDEQLRGSCVESAPQPALVGLPEAPVEATPAGPPPGAGGNVPFGEEPIQLTADPGEAALVRRALLYEPVLKVAKADRFWPVPVPAVLALSMGDRRTQFVGRDGKPHDAQLSDLRAGGGPSEFIDYPAAIEHAQDEFCSVGRALGIESVDLARWSTFPDLLRPDRTAQYYFLDRKVDRGEDLQYWFFYPYNYLPVLTLNPFFQNDPVAATLFAADFHEGDFEHVTVRLRPGGDGELRPVAVEMARHKNEDKVLPWRGPTELERDGTHPIVHAGFGGHASYAICGRQTRRINLAIRLLDWALCDEDKVFTLPSDVPLVDLRSVPWACWRGHFGEVPPHPFPELRVSGPKSPLYQAGNEVGGSCQ